MPCSNQFSVFRPLVCVWELTLECNCKCLHCGSAAGRARSGELDTSRALELIDELSELGCNSITLSGGEPLLRQDWRLLAAAIRTRGMQVELITNGLLVQNEAEAIMSAGFASVTFSVDGPSAIHDHLRGEPGSLERIASGAKALRQRGMRIGAVTQINRANLPHLSEVLEWLVLHEFGGWQLQLTMPQGRARAQSELCLRPDELPLLEERIVELGMRQEIRILVGDNIGYMSCNEPRLRSLAGLGGLFWTGCQAGLSVIGITSDGSVRGCLSQPAALNEGNLSSRRLADIWNDPSAFSYNRQFSPAQLTGACEGCAFGNICRGGCRSLAVAASGTVSHNPFCSHALTRR
jgi:radical SAM protein with 4Fe4S-binding SPASM domain